MFFARDSFLGDVGHQSGLAWRNPICQHVPVWVVAAILCAEGNRLVCEKPEQAFAPAVLDVSNVGGIDAACSINREGGQYLHAGKEQRAVRDREQQLIGGPLMPRGA